MKCTCEKDQLLSGISIVSRLATTRATLPILQNIYLEVRKEGLLLRSTDLEQTLEVEVPAQVADTGKLTVPARMLGEYLTNNSDHSLVLESDDLTLKLNSTNHQASFRGLAAEEYPTLPAAKTQSSVTLKTEAFVAALTSVLFAAAVDDSRPVLSGLLWRFGKDELEIVGTDGYRLAYTKTVSPGGITGDYVIPRRAIQELIRIADGETLELAFAGTQLTITAGVTKLTSRILEGKFPDFAAILPKKKEISVTLAAAALVRSLKLASLFSRDSAYSTKLTLEGSKLSIEATAVQLGENRNEVPLERPFDQPLTISANAQYLIEALAHISGSAKLELIDHKSPIVLRPADNGNETLYLVMPLRND